MHIYDISINDLWLVINLPDDSLIKHHKKCDLLRGKLLDTSSHLTNNVKLALKIMTDYSATQIFSAIFHHENGTYVNINSHSIEGINISTFLYN